MAGRRRGAVARAVREGARPETSEEALEDLLDLAANAGPPEVPENLGNFPGDQPARRARPEGRRATVTRLRNPRHLQSYEDERLAAEAARELEDEAPAPRRAPQRQPGMPSADVLEVAGQPAEEFDDSPARRRPARAPELEEEALPPEGEVEEEPFDEEPGVQPGTARDRVIEDLQARLADAELREAEAATRVRPAAAPAPGPASAPAGAQDPRVAQIAALHQPANLFPFNLDDAWLQTHEFSRAQADGLRQLGTVAVQRALAVAYATYGVERDLERQTQQTQVAETDHHERVTNAFWEANADLDPNTYHRLVASTSSELRQAYPNLTDGQWITLTSREVRKAARRMGARVAMEAPVTSGVRDRALARQTGAIAAPRYAAPAARIRPATMDMGGGPRGGYTNGLTRDQKEILDLARMR